MELIINIGKVVQHPTVLTVDGKNFLRVHQYYLECDCINLGSDDLPRQGIVGMWMYENTCCVFIDEQKCSNEYMRNLMFKMGQAHFKQTF